MHVGVAYKTLASVGIRKDPRSVLAVIGKDLEVRRVLLATSLSKRRIRIELVSEARRVPIKKNNGLIRLHTCLCG